jgi:hypothetical protein
MMKKRKKKKLKRISRGPCLRFFALLFLAFAVIPVCGEKPKKTAASYAVIAGTIFRDPGFSLPGAEIALLPEKAPLKVKPMKAVSDARGEYAFHVPPSEARYTVSVKAKGFEPQQKAAIVNGEVRVDVFFQLKPLAQ